ncbi:3'(2'),5'-bisphosphate nucleotidase CysQ [Polycladidibacter hongkongensis]|uniref:3'(2'),5'-bisphosphate nucleotidase CysQ n=1 Tax=Polycladidibacter hongkongensis TaxID=1647556 RepID=UPI0008369D31|nr:3'(2'),5'-bisphosphate nucleotidase CysQ [Pseudovibrio hongkongensis]
MIETMKTAALAAGNEILRIYESDFEGTLKEDGTPVTIADQRAEKIIEKILADAFADVPMIGEEAAAYGRLPAEKERIFIVDPLDGTKEFIMRNGEFTVNIALIERGVPVLGVIYAPVLQELFWGIAGEGAYKQFIDADIAEAPQSIATRGCDAEPLVALASRSHASLDTEAMIEKLGMCSVKNAGSSLKFCRVAEGSADFYPRLAPTMQWDTAAGDAILRAAGGAVVGLDGDPLRYGIAERHGTRAYENPSFLAVGDSKIISQYELLPVS